MPKYFVSAIVPAFNEEKTVFNVISILQSLSVINEVICINDGSTDSTKEILGKFQDNKKVKVINLDKNKGKGNALAVGIKNSKGDIVLFIDADLINLTEDHIHSLLKPLLQGTHRAVLGYISGKGNRNIVADLTGQRAYFKKDLEPYIDEISKTRFGVETYLNKLFRSADTIKVPLHNLRGLFKYEKQRADIALKEYLK
ncbi:MAG TPA: glycosyltransferase family 2 protein, partial [Candidatus Dojkabacteria bacterium]|nr:glycosyltransferase family 2 protein [Candidatus Dojkabacteria bacterium]